MRDAFGGVANLVIIVVFLTLVSGYLAFNVNYTKAFRVKNKIISLYAKSELASKNIERANVYFVNAYKNPPLNTSPDAVTSIAF